MATNTHYKNNRDLVLSRRNKMRRICKDYLIGLKHNKPCTDCGVGYPYYVMQFDHLFDKKFTIALTTNHTSIKRLERELAKCELVCANCHAERTWQRLKNSVDKT